MILWQQILRIVSLSWHESEKVWHCFWDNGWAGKSCWNVVLIVYKCYREQSHKNRTRITPNRLLKFKSHHTWHMLGWTHPPWLKTQMNTVQPDIATVSMPIFPWISNTACDKLATTRMVLWANQFQENTAFKSSRLWSKIQ